MQLGSPASPLMDFSGMGAGTRNSPAANLSEAGSESSELSRKTSFPSESNTEQLPSPSSLQTECTWTIGPYLEGFSFPNPYSWEQESQDKGETPADSDVDHCAFQNSLSISHSPAVPSPAQELSRRKSSEQDKLWPVNQDRVSGGGDSTAGDHVQGLDCPGPAGHAQLLGAGLQGALPSAPAGDRPRSSSWDRLDGRGGEPAQLSLYVHSIQGLVLSLLAEEQLRRDCSAVENVVSGKALPHCSCTGRGLTAEEGALNCAPRASVTCSEPCRARQPRGSCRSCRSAMGARTAASGRQLLVLLLSGTAGTGAERGGVTDTRGLPGGCAGAGIHWGSLSVRCFLGSEVGCVEAPARHRLSLGEQLRRGWQQVPERFPWLWEPPGCSLGLARGMPRGNCTWVTPEQSQISLWWDLTAQTPLRAELMGLQGQDVLAPVFPGKHQLQSCCLASASLPGAESKLQSPV